jgi:hypothetical protein
MTSVQIFLFSDGLMTYDYVIIKESRPYHRQRRDRGSYQWGQRATDPSCDSSTAERLVESEAKEKKRREKA